VVARSLGVSAPVVSDWVTGKKAIPAAHCKAITRMSEGAVTCQEMRPADWHKYWPELGEMPEGQGA
jgi:DNA-binding transcriptional regulator YdaS (Cro superfamily)